MNINIPQKNRMGTILDFGDWGEVDYNPSAKVVKAAQGGLDKIGLSWLFKEKSADGSAAPVLDPKVLMIGGGILGGLLLVMVAAKSGGKKRKR